MPTRMSNDTGPSGLVASHGRSHERFDSSSFCSTRASRSDCAAAPNCTFTEEMTNFANWYTYYRTRIQTMKTTAGQAFAGLPNNYRIGFITISPGASTGSGVSSACSLAAAKTWRRNASVKGRSSALAAPTQLASRERSSSTPSRA